MDEMKPTQPFVWGANGGAVSPEQIARRRQIAAALIKVGADLAPVGHWTQGLARLAQGGLGGLLAYRADELERGGSGGGAEAPRNETIARLLMETGGWSEGRMPSQEQLAVLRALLVSGDHYGDPPPAKEA